MIRNGVYSGGAGWPLSQSLSIYGVPMGHKFLIDPPVNSRGRYNPGYGPSTPTDARFIYDQSFDSRPGQYHRANAMNGVYTMRGVLNGLGAEEPIGNIALCAPNCADQFKGSGRVGRCANICTQVVGGTGDCTSLCADEFSNYMGRRAKCVTACNAAMRAEMLLTREGGGLPLTNGSPLATILPIAAIGIGAIILISVLKKKKAKEVRANRRRRRTRRLRSYR